ncbi:MAG: large conductance mechanosensitive channel protein MscL [Clostridiales bacterium]|nr:large conductance mechanosensitive channel protein MscL [Clostridiales bacterium]
MGFMKEFKEFALKGNVIDMAVGVIIGGAFGSIVGALTTDFINPLINSIGGAEIAGAIPLPWVDYTGLDSEAALALKLNYGDFATQVINFLILALVLFLIIKGMNKLMDAAAAKLKKQEEEKPAAPPEPSDEVKLLTEIKDILAESKK